LTFTNGLEPFLLDAGHHLVEHVPVGDTDDGLGHRRAESRGHADHDLVPVRATFRRAHVAEVQGRDLGPADAGRTISLRLAQDLEDDLSD